MIKIKKRKKSSRYHGRNMGTAGTGSRKNKRKSGHKGGKGLSGTGKRADHKKTLMTKRYGHKYFGKQGITSRKTQKDKRKKISLQKIELNLESYGKKTGNKWNIDLSKYKVLSGPKDYKIKNKLIIKANSASHSARESVKSARGEIILPEEKVKEKTEGKSETQKPVKKGEDNGRSS